ncbi:MAG: hypothetical protein BGO14_01065 [Chlamydiales bacterium 38-26]|nr:MAG: hypothetical protein BGO14_01065 [Chlamydiales bacterium 38-26]
MGILFILDGPYLAKRLLNDSINRTVAVVASPCFLIPAVVLNLGSRLPKFLHPKMCKSLLAQALG